MRENIIADAYREGFTAALQKIAAGITSTALPSLNQAVKGVSKSFLSKGQITKGMPHTFKPKTTKQISQYPTQNFATDFGKTT